MIASILLFSAGAAAASWKTGKEIPSSLSPGPMMIIMLHIPTARPINIRAMKDTRFNNREDVEETANLIMSPRSPTEMIASTISMN